MMGSDKNEISVQNLQIRTKPGINSHPYKLNLNIRPKVVPAKPGSTISKGDLHGDAMILLFSLIYHGFADGLTDEDYADIAHIYNKRFNTLTKTDLKKFDELIAKLKFKKDIRLILMGDDVADRGQNDYFTLKLIEAMDNGKMDFDILESNHGSWFLKAVESKGKDKLPITFEFINDAAGSSSGLESLVSGENPLRSRESIIPLIEQRQKHIKLISYQTFNDENGKKGLVFYTHAPYSIPLIIKLARKLDIVVNEENLNSVETLTGLIDKVNLRYQEQLEAGKGSELLYPEDVKNNLLTNELTSESYDGAGYKFSKDAVFLPLIWSRRERDLQKKDNYKGIPIRWRIGHVGDSLDLKNKQHIGNLDKSNELGKHMTLMSGTYHFDCVDPSENASHLYDDTRISAKDNDPDQIITQNNLKDYMYETSEIAFSYPLNSVPNFYKSLQLNLNALKKHRKNLQEGFFYKDGKKQKIDAIDSLISDIEGKDGFLQKSDFKMGSTICKKITIDLNKLDKFLRKNLENDNISKHWRNDPISNFFRGLFHFIINFKTSSVEEVEVIQTKLETLKTKIMAEQNESHMKLSM